MGLVAANLGVSLVVELLLADGLLASLAPGPPQLHPDSINNSRKDSGCRTSSDGKVIVSPPGMIYNSIGIAVSIVCRELPSSLRMPLPCASGR